MQAGSDSKGRGAVRQGFSKIMLYTFMCFALAGLLAGFAFGGFVEHQQNASLARSHALAIHTSSIAAQAPETAISPTAEDILPANPLIGSGDYTSTETADGTTSYTLSAQVMNKATNTALQVQDVTCRLWLTRDVQGTQAALSANNYALPKTVNALDQPFPAEEQGALDFTGSTRQVQPCATNGKTTWTYALSPALEHGIYFLVVLADWKGIHYNWYLVRITAIKGKQGDNNNGNNDLIPGGPEINNGSNGN